MDFLVELPRIDQASGADEKEIETDEFLYTYRVGGSFAQAFSRVRAVSLWNGSRHI